MTVPYGWRHLSAFAFIPQQEKLTSPSYHVANLGRAAGKDKHCVLAVTLLDIVGAAEKLTDFQVGRLGDGSSHCQREQGRNEDGLEHHGACIGVIIDDCLRKSRTGLVCSSKHCPLDHVDGSIYSENHVVL